MSPEGHGLPFASGEVRDREMVGDSPDRSEPGSGPLSGNRHRLARFAEPEEAAADACGHAGRLDRDSEHVVEVELGADASSRSRRRGRSRSRASARASAERARSSASARLGGESLEQRRLPPVNTRGAFVVATTSTAGTFSSETSGTKTALFAPLRSARRRFTCCELATS